MINESIIVVLVNGNWRSKFILLCTSVLFSLTVKVGAFLHTNSLLQKNKPACSDSTDFRTFREVCDVIHLLAMPLLSKTDHSPKLHTEQSVKISPELLLSQAVADMTALTSRKRLCEPLFRFTRQILLMLVTSRFRPLDKFRLTGVAIFGDIVPCGPYVNRLFGGTYHLHSRG
jgi:hypothetical protein